MNPAYRGRWEERRWRLPARKRLRPASRRDVGERLKLHRRLIRIDGREYTVITPRPGFSANLWRHNATVRARRCRRRKPADAR